MVTGAVRETRVERWTLSYDPEPCKALRGSKWPVSMWVCPTEGGQQMWKGSREKTHLKGKWRTNLESNQQRYKT